MMNKLKTLARHIWLDASDTRRAIPEDMLRRLTLQVAASEQGHTGQIRLCIESSLPLSYLRRLGTKTSMASLCRQRAIMLFGKLRVWDTEHNNGVLIYVLLAERAIELVADRGVARFVDAAVWRDTVARLGVALREDRFEDGLTQALQEVSAVLVAHFPASGEAPGEAVNQLPDEPVLR